MNPLQIHTRLESYKKQGLNQVVSKPFLYSCYVVSRYVVFIIVRYQIFDSPCLLDYHFLHVQQPVPFVVSLHEHNAHSFTPQILQVVMWHVFSSINYSTSTEVSHLCLYTNIQHKILTLVGIHNLKHMEGVLRK